MARPIKDGVDYFPKNTDFYQDDKVRLLRARFGAKGMYLLDYLLCEIYGKNGYYTEWNVNKCFLVSDGAGCGCDSGFVKEFITGCLQCSFFDERVFNVFGVLTSSGIQRRYIRMFNSREEIQIIKEYCLLDLSDKKDVPNSILNKLTLKSVKSTENPDKSTENSQNKEKEIKKDESKNNSSAASSSCSEQAVVSLPLNDNSLYHVSPQKVAEWRDAYQSIDIIQELKKMRSWLIANPKKRRTIRGIERFIVAWLSRAQDQGGSRLYSNNTDYSDTNRYEQMKGVAGVEYDES